uniref:FAM161 centrosomal protein A n=1 Tax=Cyprinodon variegatus TaxID=28743 RepID=A0A3Q2E9Y4_CYPVA
MANPHRTNILVTSCLKTPVDPHTKAPLASYERDRVLPFTARSHLDNRDYEKELEYEEMGSDFCHEDYLEKGVPHIRSGHKAAGGFLDLSKIFFSNEEYYSKLEELKKAHLRTMAELESMYQQKLQLKSMEPLDMATLELGCRKQDIQRKKEYRQEIKEMQERVKGRPLLLEQVTQRNARQAAEKHYIQTLQGCDVTEAFIRDKAAKSASECKISTSREKNQR